MQGKRKMVQKSVASISLVFFLAPTIRSSITRRRAGEGDLNATKIGTDRKFRLLRMLAPIFHHQDQAIVPSFPWKPIFRALDPWLCPFSTPSHSCLKRHEKAHNEHNATLSTLTTLHWCFIIQVKKMKSCHILFSPRYHHSEPILWKPLPSAQPQTYWCTINWILRPPFPPPFLFIIIVIISFLLCLQSAGSPKHSLPLPSSWKDSLSIILCSSKIWKTDV